ncbi:3'-5' exonuclease [Eisenibacter elegans]|jgi:DNA polymerase-3 subunit epsilon|uniref:3'-5' exonuclease n=1 Tax=Eisenibacter elegans TaxID=997 RepID=UPI00040C6CF8|nr:3'-5' exonuclease [Eisenibacter elegans]
MSTPPIDRKHSLNLRKPLAFFDLETTGINITNDRIVEIAILKAMPNGELLPLTKRINPGRAIPLESSLIHGIYDEDVADAPLFKMVAKELYKFLEGCDLAGFNSIRFDVPMLVEEFLRAELDLDLSNRRLIDAQRIFHLMEPRNLSAAYKFYCDETLENAHSAEADTYATYRVLEAQVQRYEGVEIKNGEGQLYTPVKNDMDALHQITAEKMVDLAGRLGYNSKGEEIFKFGKHRDKTVLEVLQKEPSYYDWMLKGDFPLDTKRKLTEIKLRNFNKK